jgi:hypothetical protein
MNDLATNPGETVAKYSPGEWMAVIGPPGFAVQSPGEYLAATCQISVPVINGKTSRPRRLEAARVGGH